MDRIYIRDLSLRCIIGIFPDERENMQDVVINVTLDCASHHVAALSDDITDAVDYKTITKKIIDLVEPSSFNLLETMAEAIVSITLEHPRVLCSTVCIDKPGALRFARSVAVEITRISERDQ
ncbi:MAG: D-erythro-7,8-dihydroneopterin triphosphate epimerase [Kiritimatiellia bacterium]|jgi:D-erythro-7,8-dihydroneopterin triphosphate epimerase